MSLVYKNNKNVSVTHTTTLKNVNVMGWTYW